MMHTEQQLRDIGLLNKGLQLLNFDVAFKPDSKRKFAVPCRFINNEDGSLRWLWPASATTPQILRFYNEVDKGGKWVNAIKAAFKLRMPGLVSSGKVVLYTTAIGARLLQQLTDWALSTGREGINRKLVIWHKDKQGQSAFTKLSLSIYAARNIYNERQAIQEAAPLGVVMPANIDTRCFAFTQQDLFEGQKSISLDDTNDLPREAMQGWLGHSIRLQRLSEVSWYQEAQAWLHGPKRTRDERISEVLLQKMRTLIDCMLPQAMVPVARAHGDFTPWNIRRRGDELLSIDWEQSRDDMPALYDLFHFIYTNNILVKKQSFSVIRREIDEMLRLPEWESFLLEHDIDPGEAEQQYLLSNISHFLREYAKQVRWHTEAPVLMQAWCEALGFWMDYEGLLTQRQIVLQDVAHFLHDKQYAAMKLCVEDITMLSLSSTLELCMPAAISDQLLAYLNRHRCVERLRIRRSTFKREISIFLSGGSNIHIDCIREMRLATLVFANAKQILASAKLNEAGVKLPAINEDLRYTRLYYLLSGTGVPQQYRDHYLGQTISIQSQLLTQMQAEGAPANKPFAAMLQYDESYRQRSRAYLKRLPVNRGMQRLRNTSLHCLDTLRTLIPSRGFAITFSGVDGVGRNTVIEATRHRIVQELRMPVVVLPHRPSLLPMLMPSRFGHKNHEAANAIPLSQAVARPSLFGGLWRFLYYYIDYLIGQCYVYLRYVMRGYVVLYDHYFDLFSGTPGSKVVLPAAYTSWWYRFLLKPDLNFLLYAPANAVMERRQELSAQDIEQLTGQYLALFERLERSSSGHAHFISVRNMRLGDTMETLFHYIKERQAEAAA